MSHIAIDTRIEAGAPGTDEYDTGVVQFLGDAPDLPSDIARIPHRPTDVWVGWDSGVASWIAEGDCRPLNASPGFRR